MTRRVRFGEVFELQRRNVEVSLDDVYREIGVRSFGRGLFVKELVSGADLGAKRVFRIHEGDLVISNVFGWEGAVAVAEETHRDLIGSHRFMTWTSCADVDKRFVQHFLVSDSGLELLRRASPGSAGRNRTLSVKNLEQIEVPLPPITEQRRIAAHLDRLATSGRDAGDRGQAWSGRYRALHDRIVADQGGQDVALREILRSASGESVDKDATYKIAGVYSFGRGLLRRGDISGTETKYRTFTRLSEGQIVYSKLGAFENAVGLVTEDFVGHCVSPEFPVFGVVEDVDPRYLIAALTTSGFAEAMTAASTGVGARQRRVSPSGFLNMRVAVPPLSNQRRAAAALGTLARAGRLEARSRGLANALLPAARNEIFTALR